MLELMYMTNREVWALLRYTLMHGIGWKSALFEAARIRKEPSELKEFLRQRGTGWLSEVTTYDVKCTFEARGLNVEKRPT